MTPSPQHSGSTESAAPVGAPRRTGLLLLGLFLALASVPVFSALMNVSWVLRTGAPAFVLLILGSLVGLLAQRGDRRIWAKALGGTPVVLLALGTYFFFVVGAIPAPRVALAGDAPDFTLPDQTGTPVHLRTELARGPVLLVFYRGFW